MNTRRDSTISVNDVNESFITGRQSKLSESYTVFTESENNSKFDLRTPENVENNTLRSQPLESDRRNRNEPRGFMRTLRRKGGFFWLCACIMISAVLFVISCVIAFSILYIGPPSIQLSSLKGLKQAAPLFGGNVTVSYNINAVFSVNNPNGIYVIFEEITFQMFNKDMKLVGQTNINSYVLTQKTETEISIPVVLSILPTDLYNACKSGNTGLNVQINGKFNYNNIYKVNSPAFSSVNSLDCTGNILENVVNSASIPAVNSTLPTVVSAHNTTS